MDAPQGTLSPRAEFAIVIAAAFGWPILGSLLSLFLPGPAQTVDAGALDSILVYEGLVAAFLIPFLRRRDWTLSQLGLQFARQDVVLGLLLALFIELVFMGLWHAATAAGLPPADNIAVAKDLGLARVALVSLVNGAFEEIFVCGYVLGALAGRRSAWFAVNLSTAIRLSYHLYQGGPGVIGAVPMGLICAGWYARTGRLWPVILAHAALDFVAFLAP